MLITFPACLAPIIAIVLEVLNLFFKVSSLALLIYSILPTPTILNLLAFLNKQFDNFNY